MSDKVCTECKKRKATKRVAVVVDRFQVENVDACDRCAKKLHEHNAKFAN